MEHRTFGNTGERFSVVGFGGIIVMNETEDAAKRYVAQAIERGVNYFDVAPSYGDAEVQLGPALQPYRERVFLACKTGERTREGSRTELKRSLERLKTDHFDLYQLHGITTMEDVEKVTGPDGALQTLKQARNDGTVRYVGFSAHAEEPAIELLRRFDFDSILFPINWTCWLRNGFGQKLLGEAERLGIGRLCLKALAKRKWADDQEHKKWPKCWYCPVESPQEASLALRFTLSLPVTAAVSPGHADLLWWACDAAEGLLPLSDAERDKLRTAAEQLDPIFP